VASVLREMLDQASLFISGGKFMSTTGTYTLPHNEGKYRVLPPLVITSKPFEYV
jgi:L-lactate utilization protein LutB